MKMIALLLLIFLTCAPGKVIGQSKTPDVTEWAKKLADPADTENAAYFSLSGILKASDTTFTLNFLEQIIGEVLRLIN